ncbi:MAG: zinc-binding dehydrogenase [Chloroflexia bacterium]
MSVGTMPAVVHWGAQPGEVELREMPRPVPQEGEVLLRVAAVGVCGTDVHLYTHGASASASLPVVLGHEFCGVIEAVGPWVRGWREGDRVVSETAAYVCGECAYCRSGRYNVCPRRRGFGFGADGAMATHVRVPVRCLHSLPGELSFEVAALTEPCCVAYNALVERSKIRPGDSVLILGPGPIGLLCLLVAQLMGAGETIVVGLASDGPRLAVARELGAGCVLDAGSQDAAEFVRTLGDGHGVDVVVDASGASAAFTTAMEVVRPGGRITKVGWGRAPLGESLDPLVRKAVTVNGSFSHTYETWERVVALLASGKLEAARLTGYTGPLEKWLDGFERMHRGEVVKSLLLAP